MLGDKQLQSLKELLTQEYEWPSQYLFKFVTPKDKTDKVKALFPEQEIQERQSANGKYVGLSINIYMESPDTVIAVYQQASKIKGIISL